MTRRAHRKAPPKRNGRSLQAGQGVSTPHARQPALLKASEGETSSGYDRRPWQVVFHIFRRFRSVTWGALVWLLQTRNRWKRRQVPLPQPDAEARPARPVTSKVAPTRNELIMQLHKLVSPHLSASVTHDLNSYVQDWQGPHDGKLRVLILRGPPGLGKSTYAARYLRNLPHSANYVHTCSTDLFYTKVLASGEEKYSFNSRLLGKNHSKNQTRVALSMKMHLSPIIVDNTCMRLWELSPYIRLAFVHGYDVEVIEPWDVNPRWNDLAFLQERNAARAGLGKDIDVEVLKTMIQRFEPYKDLKGRKETSSTGSSSSSGSKGTATSLRVPRYVGVNLAEALHRKQLEEVWKALEPLRAVGVNSRSLKLSSYSVPKPPHVTTFFRDDLRDGSAPASMALEDAYEGKGEGVTVHCVAVAFIPNGLACLVVSHTEPLLATVVGKLLHVTLAVRSPWAPVHSNDVLQAMEQAGHIQRSEREAPLASGLPTFGHVSLLDMGEHGVKHIDGLQLPNKAVEAYLVELSPAVILRGVRACFWS